MVITLFIFVHFDRNSISVIPNSSFSWFLVNINFDSCTWCFCFFATRNVVNCIRQRFDKNPKNCGWRFDFLFSYFKVIGSRLNIFFKLSKTSRPNVGVRSVKNMGQRIHFAILFLGSWCHSFLCIIILFLNSFFYFLQFI